ncbi:2-keto-4-pentenoate hydratase [Kyrpidia spormannii]|uniref:2-keto-4-pentenoate hydratase n=2 Tax=Kyrpidia spormannii TaxID=2055160 RepID=A0ACA8ZAF2_9BACL|nr:2-keto-4-pentenoate hydratase [Kyrpidia spormannii]CAB3393573.1 2-keto-4-pentenoate hydratase [Kyrpidia spormannii]CAB3394495.1 2-keto-4-pentenoate hydratase [Kyrpidia spormannii]
MALGAEALVVWAERLFRAEGERRPIPPLTEEEPGITVQEAYRVQLEVVRRKLALGETVVGHKIGLTSRPMQEMFGVGEPDYGHLFRSMAYESGSEIDYPLLQPRVEAEIAFILKRDLEGPGLGIHDVLQATDYVVPAIEVVDSRIENWRIKLPDTVADNASSGCFVLGGRPTRVEDVDLELVGMVLSEDGEVVQTGAGAAVLGHPAFAVAWLANKLAEFGTPLKAGHVVLSGAVSAAVAAKAGSRYVVNFGKLGRVEAVFPQQEGEA